MKALFEAVVNAVAHRDYSVIGSKIRLFLFDDRIELFSPGNTPDTLSIHSLDQRQFTRNENISNLLSRIPVKMDFVNTKRQFMMDKYGEGLPVILSESETLSGRKPKYELIDGSEIKLTIWANLKA